MANLRARNAVLLSKEETLEGSDITPAAADAVRIEDLLVDPQANMIETNEHTGSLDAEGPIVGGLKMNISFSVLLKHSGTAATPPEFGKLLEACGWEETITSTAVPSSAEALGAGGSTTTAELGASATGTADLYNGMPIDFTESVPGSSFISDYTAGKVATLTDTMGGALNADTDYQIPVNVRYKPSSATPPSHSMYCYFDGLLYKMVGCRGDFDLAVDAGGIGRINFRFMGLLVSKTDAAVVSSPVFQSTRPPVWKNGAFKMGRVASAASRLTLACGNTLVMPGDPNKSEGFDYPTITRRNLRGSADPLEELVATRDIFGDFRAGTRKIIHARWGTTAGNRIGLTIPQAHYTGQSPGNRDDLLGVTVPFAAVGTNDGAYLDFY